MSLRFEVFVVDDADGSHARHIREANPPWLSATSLPVASLREIDDELMRSVVKASSAEFLVFGNGSVSDSLIANDGSVFIYLELAEDYVPKIDELALWRDSPAVAALFDPADRALGFAIRRDVFDRVGGFRKVDRPLFDWTIRAALAGEPILAKQTYVDREPWSIPLLAPPRPPESREWLRAHLQQFTPTTGEGEALTGLAATAIRAGLLLRHDYLDESHELAQSVEGQGDQRGDYWHAILHRREPDYANAKYWFRQIGTHPLMGELAPRADDLMAACKDGQAATWRRRLFAKSRWDPFAFVDLCEACAEDEASELALAARRTQLVEMSLLIRMT